MMVVAAVIDHAQVGEVSGNLSRVRAVPLYRLWSIQELR
jgi:hypothetical protein